MVTKFKEPESAITRSTENEQLLFAALQKSMETTIVGQSDLVAKLIIALLADGHLLIEGAPGLAKTKAIKQLAEHIDSDFHRIQFTPDLLPSDLTGTDIYQPQTGGFTFQSGPLFNNIVLADEINRAPAKVQSALLEAMAERQITIGKTTHTLPGLFMVMATQNPIEQEGTYPLPEAQLDRFLLYVRVGYPDAGREKEIMHIAYQEAVAENDAGRLQPVPLSLTQPLSEAAVLRARSQVLNMHLAEPVREYIAQLVIATRNPAAYGDDIAQWIEFGVSPRGSIGLERCARAHAWLNGQQFVTPGDVQAMARDVLGHRIILSYAAEAQGITTDRIIETLFDRVPVP